MHAPHLEKLLRIRLADVLVEEGVLDRAKVEEAQAEQDATGKQLGEILIETELLSDYDLAKLVATHYSLPYLDVTGYTVRRDVMELLPLEFCARHAVLPLDQFGAMLTLAVAEIPHHDVLDEILRATNLTPTFFVAMRRSLLNQLEDEKKRGRSAKPVTGPVAAKAGKPAAAADGEDAAPDLDLPTVPLKLSGIPGARLSSAGNRGTSVGRDLTPAPKPPAGSKHTPAAALSWMDAVGAPPKAADAKAGEKTGEKPEAKAPVSKYGGAPRATSVGAVPAAKPSPVAASPKTAPAAGKPAEGASPDGAWQSIFDAAEESVKKAPSKK